LLQITAALERRGAVASLSLTVAIETAGSRGGDYVRCFRGWRARVYDARARLSSERGGLQEIGILRDNRAPALCARERIVKQSPFVLGIAANLIGP
jgi:hypothetical protein